MTKTATRAGSDLLRDAAAARCRKGSGALVARSVGISAQALDAWTRGDARLPGPVLATLAVELFGGMAVYDQERDVLRPVPKAEPVPWGTVRVPPATGTPVNTSARPRLRVPPLSLTPAKPRDGWVTE